MASSKASSPESAQLYLTPLPHIMPIPQSKVLMHPLLIIYNAKPFLFYLAAQRYALYRQQMMNMFVFKNRNEIGIKISSKINNTNCSILAA
jgi:hypothetical protein